MNNERIEKLKEFVQNDPKDTFSIYALAIEYMTEKPEESIQYFELLLKDYPEYHATYYHAAQVYIELEEFEKAEATFKMGIEILKSKNEWKALSELQNAYNNFLFEMDD